MSNKLPNKPSELLSLALKDLTAAERTKTINIDMGIYYEKNNDKTCSVCLAGSIMAKTLKDKTKEIFKTKKNLYGFSVTVHP